MTHRDRTGALALAALALLPALAAAAPAPPGAARCAVAARVFLEGLVPDQRKRAVQPFASELRTFADFPPGHAPARSGVYTGELADGQRVRLHDLIGCALSSQGYQKAIAVIRRADAATESLAKVPAADRETAAETTSSNYAITLFGEPSDDKPWGWRIEGYHLWLNFTVANGELAVGPMYLGADPAVMTKGQWAGFRVMDTEFARGLELLETLTPAQRERAVVSATLPREMVTTPVAKQAPKPGEGLPASALDDAQRAALWRLVDEYVGEAEPVTAARIRARIEAAGMDRLSFAWMGPTARGQPVYYRVRGPAIEIEFLHASADVSDKGVANINHIHTWWHVPGADFGADLPAAGAKPKGGAAP